MQYNTNIFDEEEEKRAGKENKTAGSKITPTNPAANSDAVGGGASQGASVFQEGKTDVSAGASLDSGNSGLTDGLVGNKETAPASVGVRNVLENEYNVDPDALGYDGTWVTLNGQKLIKPQENRDGTTYVRNQEDIAKGLSEYVQKNGLVAIRDYAASRGVPVNVEWNAADGTVSIGGRTIKPAAVIGGKAYISQRELDDVLMQNSKDTGVRAETDILKEVYDMYGDGIRNAYNKYMNSGSFSYNPETDRAYQDFMDMYKRGVQDEYEKNLAQAKFRTGGVASPAVMQQAAAIRERALADAAQYGQQFEDRAYGRWQDGRGQALDEMTAGLSMLQNMYGLKSGANNSARDAYYKNYAHDWENEMNRLTYAQNEDALKTSLLDGLLYRNYAQPFYESEYNNLKLSDLMAIINAIKAEKDSGVYTGVSWQEMLKNAGLV